jgi:dihydrofolate reductase
MSNSSKEYRMPEQSQRKLILEMSASLDGMVAIPRGDGLAPVVGGQWGVPSEDPKLIELKLSWLWDTGAHLMGRVTYTEMAGFWPTSSDAYAAPMNEIPKVVFSKTLERAEWPESQIARGDLAEEVSRLKGEPGKDLVAWGGATFAQALASNDLIDEYRLITHPVAAGVGAPLFKDLQTPLVMELVDSITFPSANVRVYRRT